MKQIAIKVNPKPLFHAELFPELPHTVVDDAHPSPGWTVISANDRLIKHSSVTGVVLQRTDYRGLVKALQPALAAARPWYETIQPTERVSGFLLFYISAVRDWTER